MMPGTVITIPANAKHWHGAASGGWFSHLAISIPGEGTSNEWCEPVSDAEYGSKKMLAFQPFEKNIQIVFLRFGFDFQKFRIFQRNLRIKAENAELERRLFVFIR